MKYAQIRHMDISNGENVGVALFVQGCHFHCENCFNSETWDFNCGKKWTKDIKEQFFKLIDRPYIKRVSILGGEPLEPLNMPDICNLIFEIKEKFPTKTIWLYTGYTFDYLKEMYKTYQFAFSPYNEWIVRWDIIKMCDVLVDGQYIDSERDITLKWRGSKNQRVIDVQKSLSENKIVLYCD